MPQTDRPNILFIMDDQHRFDYMGCAGADFVRTPNIDRLAKQGVHFTQCTTNCPVCAPSRIALASGVQPSRPRLHWERLLFAPQPTDLLPAVARL